MTFDSHRRLLGEAVTPQKHGPYVLTPMQSADWHDPACEGLRQEIRAEARRRGVAVVDVDGDVLHPAPIPA
jgi:hypothetical protein